LDGAFLSNAWGDAGAFQEHAAQLPELLQAAVDNGRRRFADNREFLHALAEVEAERIDALWACYDEKRQPQDCLTHIDVLNRLAARYCDLLKRLGSAREQDSVINRLRFFIALLPADEMGTKVQEALQRLIEGIGLKK
jgi:hypothetical protein